MLETIQNEFDVLLHQSKGLSPFIYVAFQALQIIIVPIPGQFLNVIGGGLFGWPQSTALGVVGHFLGSISLVALARKFGIPLLRRLFKKVTIQKYSTYVEKKGLSIVFVLFLLPFFPDDMILLACALSGFPFTKLVAAFTIGRIPGILLYSMLGDGLLRENSVEFWLYFAAYALLFYFSYVLFRKTSGSSIMQL
jgi:uncharacterized membrane protein YdjX (TVP38/TMEM64 family)